MRFQWKTASLLASLVVLGCNGDAAVEEPAPADTVQVEVDRGPEPGPILVVPGKGLESESLAVEIGKPLGVGGATVRGLGALGSRFSLGAPWPGVHGLLSPEGTVHTLVLDGSFAGRTAEGVGIGSAGAALEAAFGAAAVDPFARHRWYREAGIGFEVEGDTVKRIFVASPQ